MKPNMTVRDDKVLELLDRIGPNVHRALEQALQPIADDMTEDARSRAESHIHYLGAKNPGSYVASIHGGVAADSPTRVTGYVRSSHPLAHLMELGFTISDLTITASAAEVMAFQGDAGMVFARTVHRHETQVKPYPAILPAFEARKEEIIATLTDVARHAGKN